MGTGRGLDLRLTLSDKELHAFGSETERKEQDLEKVGKDNGGKSALFKRNNHFYKTYFDIIKILD